MAFLKVRVNKPGALLNFTIKLDGIFIGRANIQFKVLIVLLDGQCRRLMRRVREI